MDLYFSPLSCSMASRIAFYEAGAPARFIEVDRNTRRTLEGEDFLAVNPLGFVPVLRTADGELVTENAAILQYIADSFRDAALAPRDGMARTRLQQWLSFTATELHKGLFSPFFDPRTSEEAKQRALEKGDSRFAYLNACLAGREFLLDSFSVADAYLFTVLNWTNAASIDLRKWPAVHDYYTRLKLRPSIQRALTEEQALYAAAAKRRQAA